jgi:predicted phage-related endonuclease
MSIERWTITGRDEWLERRKANINGSEIGALFGQSPYMTRLGLYAEKAGLADMQGPDSDVLRRGRWLEPAIPVAVLEQKPDWKIEKSDAYFSSPDLRIGCTPDFIVHCPTRGAGVLQGKTVAKPVFDADWQDGPPLWIILQTLQEMMLTEVQWGAIGVLIVSSYTVDCRVWEFERHAETEARIIFEAAKFWTDVEAGVEPAPDYSLDADVIRAIYPRDNGTTIDLSRDNRMPELLDEFERLNAEEKGAAKQLKAVKAEIAAKLGDAAAATLPGWEVRNTTVERAGYTVQPTSYRQLRVKRTASERKAA